MIGETRFLAETMEECLRDCEDSISTFVERAEWIMGSLDRDNFAKDSA